MDMTGLKTIKAKDLKVNDIICNENWTKDRKVLSIENEEKTIRVELEGICKDINPEKAEKNFSYDEEIIIVKK